MQKGLTLIETLVWAAVFTASMMAIVVSIMSFYRANTYTLEQAQAVSDARRAIERTIQYAREASYSSDGAYPLVSIATSSITFYADIDADPAIERVHYYIQGTNLMQGVLNPSGTPLAYTGAETVTVLSPFIRNDEQGVDTFAYYDTEGALVTDFSDVTTVRFLTMDVVVNVSPTRLPNELTLHSSATLRNLRNDL